MKYSEIIENTLTNGGVTYNEQMDAFLTGQYYVVSMYPTKEKIVLLEDFTERTIHNYLVANFILLQDPRNSLGTWVNDGKIYLDISRTLTDKETALNLGRKHNQLAIFDLGNLEEIIIEPIEECNQFDSLLDQFKADEQQHQMQVSSFLNKAPINSLNYIQGEK